MCIFTVEPILVMVTHYCNPVAYNHAWLERRVTQGNLSMKDLASVCQLAKGLVHQQMHVFAEALRKGSAG